MEYIGPLENQEERMQIHLESNPRIHLFGKICSFYNNNQSFGTKSYE